MRQTISCPTNADVIVSAWDLLSTFATLRHKIAIFIYKKDLQIFNLWFQEFLII
jgi:hypothetical protein